MKDFDDYETYTSALEKIMDQTHESNKTAIRYRKFMIALLNMKFGRYYCSRDVNIGQDKRKKWEEDSRKILNFTPIAPIVQENFLDKWSLIKKDDVVSKEFDRIHNNIQHWKDMLKKAEMDREDEIREQRLKDKAVRQRAIDVENELKRQKYLKEIEDREEKIKDLESKNKQIELVEVLTDECKPTRPHPDIDFKVLDPKYKFKGRYSNGSIRQIKHIKNVQGDTSKLFSIQYDIHFFPKYQDGELIEVPGNLKTFYFEKGLKLGNNAVQERINVPMPEEPKLIPDAKTEVTEVIMHGSLDSDLEIKHYKDVKVPRQETNKMIVASKEIQGWQKAKKTVTRFAANIFDKQNKDTAMNYNKFAVLKNHQACWNLANYVENKPDKLTQANVGDKLDLKSDRLYDSISDVRLFKKGKQLTKEEVNLHKNKIREVKSKYKKFKEVNVEKRLTFREVVIMILNSKLLKECKINSEKYLDDSSIDEYLELGYLTKQTTGLNKGHRKVAERILRAFYWDVFK